MGHGKDIDKAIRTYFMVFGALMLLTLLTVAASYLDFSVAVGVSVGLFIAFVKGTLVAGFFMHLFDERKIIYWILLLTVTFFVVLFFVPIFTNLDHVAH